MRILIVFLLYVSVCFSQKQHEGLIFDKDEKKPLEFVSIFNSKNHTVSNKDGRYLFSSKQDSIYFYKTGYKKIKTTLIHLKDTIYLEKNPLELDEVVVTNAKTLFQKIGDSIQSNYLFEPYNEKFFLRCVLRHNDTITRIQDLQGKLRRKTLLYGPGMELTNKDYTIELTNMRKVGLTHDSKNIYFEFPTFFGMLSNFARINATGDGFEMTEKSIENGAKTKWSFTGKTSAGIISGYYLLNMKNNAIEYLVINGDLPNNPYSSDKKFKYKTTFYKVEVFFTKNKTNNKYTISLGRLSANIETTDKEHSYTSNYNSEFTFTTSNSFENFSVKKNVSPTKDIFKIKYKYDEAFWRNQNQLLLTNEMMQFITKVKDNKEFRVKTNIK